MRKYANYNHTMLAGVCDHGKRHCSCMSDQPDSAAVAATHVRSGRRYNDRGYDRTVHIHRIKCELMHSCRPNILKSFKTVLLYWIAYKSVSILLLSLPNSDYLLS